MGLERDGVVGPERAREIDAIEVVTQLTKDRWKGIEDPELRAALRRIADNISVVADNFRTGYEIYGDLQGWIARGSYDKEHCRRVLKQWIDTAIDFELLKMGITSGNSNSPDRKRLGRILYAHVAPDALL
jgi:hypothetical protein